MNREISVATETSPPFIELRRDGKSDFFIVVDHAGRAIPDRLDSLGLAPCDLDRHIAWDIGALGLAESLSERLDAPVIAQKFSRLVIDCNRAPGSPSSIAAISEDTEIPGNRDIAADEADRRRREIFDPYHARIARLLDERADAGRRTILIAQHTMTDVYKGLHRPMQAAVMHNRDDRFALELLDALRRDPALTVGNNEPYALTDLTDYTLPEHGEKRGLLHVGIEIRQDLVATADGQKDWAARLADCLEMARQAFVLPNML